MTKLLAITIMAIAASFNSRAGLPDGSIAPNWTLTDINGNTHTLYDYLDQGKTVIIDISAAWCGPCWGFHKSGILEDIYKHHGPAGYPGVAANTTDDVMVFLIETDAGNTRAQLYGTTTSANYSQGNWVAGVDYPIIDTTGPLNAAINYGYNVTGYPTVTMICRDRLTYSVRGEDNAASIYARTKVDCPTYPPAQGAQKDIKAVEYQDIEYFLCLASPTIKFQNYSQSANITSATIDLYNGNSLIRTGYWWGNIDPYEVGSFTFPGFTVAAHSPYRFEVTTNNDIRTSNNKSKDSLFKAFTKVNAKSLPYIETFDGKLKLPDNYARSLDHQAIFIDSDSMFSTMVQADGSHGNAASAMLFNFPAISGTSELFAGNYNTKGASSILMEFDVAYSPYSPTSPEEDQLEVKVSKDCGTHWTSVWRKKGDTLQTVVPTGGGFTPESAAHWRRESIWLNAFADENMMVKFVAKSDKGNYAWIDNVKFSNSTTAVREVVAANTLSLYPNPAAEAATLRFVLNSSTTASVQVLDITGKAVATIADAAYPAGEHTISIPTERLPAGLYMVRLQTTTGIQNLRLSVVH